jgi:glyceraldehyde-3-phosphate dehydrogenase/erythrose-4-phosphate dehydrogenase
MEETLKEAAKKRYIEGVYVINGIDICEASRECFIEGAKWQANQNQEAINKLISIIEWYDDESDVRPDAETFIWFEQFKKK